MRRFILRHPHASVCIFILFIIISLIVILSVATNGDTGIIAKKAVFPPADCIKGGGYWIICVTK